MKTVKELEMAVKIVEAIEYFNRLIRFSTENIKVGFTASSTMYHNHKIDIYARCIERLKLRYKNLMNE